MATAREAIRGAREAIVALQHELKAQEARTHEHIVATTRVESDVERLRRDVDRLDGMVFEQAAAVRRLTDTLDDDERAAARARLPTLRNGAARHHDAKIAESAVELNSAKARVYLALAAGLGAVAAWLASLVAHVTQ